MNADRRSFTLQGDLVGGELQQFLAALASFATIVQVVVRPALELSPSGESILRRLEPFLLERIESSEWPGTKLFGETADLFRYRYDDACRSLLVECAAGLFSWQQPDAPEDLALLRRDKTPVLGTISHERDAFLEFDSGEFRQVRAAIPWIQARLIEE